MEEEGLVKIALNNSLILNNILKSMDWQTLCVCRQVSETFYDNSLRIWRELAPPIRLCDSEDIPMMNTDILNGLSLDLEKEKKFRWGGVNKPINISVICTKVTMGWMDNFPFLGTRADCINKLYIDAFKFGSLKQLRDIVGCKNTPNLTSLGLDNLRFDMMNVGEASLPSQQKDDIYKVVESLKNLELGFSNLEYSRWPFGWNDFLSMYPNLKKIRLADYLPAELNVIVKAMVDLHKANKLPSLMNIDFKDGSSTNTPKFPLPLYEAVRDEDNFLPNLNSISIAISHSDNRNTLPDLLKCLSDKLRHLKITGSFTGKNRSLKVLVIMPNLVSITLKRYHLKNLNFLRNTPNLEKLYIYETRRLLDSHNVIETTKWEDDGTDSVKVECKYLNTFACNQVVCYNDENISCLQNWMPNLSTLKLHLNDSSFFAICKHFPKLQRLHICQSKVTDYGYTGDRFCGRFKDSDDINDKKRSEYYGKKFSVRDSELPLTNEPDDSDADEPGRINNAAKTEYEQFIASDDEYEKDLSVEEEEMEEEEEDDEVEYVDDLELAEDDDSDDDHHEGNLSGNDDEGSEDVSDSNSSEDVTNKWDDDYENAKILRRRSILAAERRYQRNADYYMPPGEVHPYNATCLEGLQVLVIERCKTEYGRSGLVSTIPFLQIFSGLLQLRQVWAEDGAITESALEYAFEHGLYFNYFKENEERPKFID